MNPANCIVQASYLSLLYQKSAFSELFCGVKSDTLHNRSPSRLYVGLFVCSWYRRTARWRGWGAWYTDITTGKREGDLFKLHKVVEQDSIWVRSVGWGPPTLYDFCCKILIGHSVQPCYSFKLSGKHVRSHPWHRTRRQRRPLPRRTSRPRSSSDRLGAQVGKVALLLLGPGGED